MADADEESDADSMGADVEAAGTTEETTDEVQAAEEPRSKAPMEDAALEDTTMETEVEPGTTAHHSKVTAYKADISKTNTRKRMDASVAGHTDTTSTTAARNVPSQTRDTPGPRRARIPWA